MPATVAVPEMTPAVLRLKPDGRLPLMIAHVIGAVPAVVFSRKLYGVPATLAGKVTTLITGATAVLTMSIDRTIEKKPATFSALTVKPNVPIDVGVPEITPPVLKLRPGGKLPASIDHVIGAVPVT